MKLEERMQLILERQKEKGRYRTLAYKGDLVDFSSNDYLGLAKHEDLMKSVHEAAQELRQYGSTGSRLLSGHHPLMEGLEEQLADFHNADTALLFNSGFDANLSFLSTIPRKGDLILYDSLVHASMHDGMRLSKAESLAFKHNDLDDLEEKLKQRKPDQICFVLVESVYSMDGDLSALKEIVELSEQYEAQLFVDEAHATGTIGPKGAGLVQALGLEARIFARLHTFGKGIGAHGAVILGGAQMREYLINFARPFIFSTAMPPHGLLHIYEAYRLLYEYGDQWVSELTKKIEFFRKEVGAHPALLKSKTAIQGFIIPGNEAVLAAAQVLEELGFDVRPIRVPTVAAGEERLRICLHLFNTEKELADLAVALRAL
jgi:8-amino-7-oxononanoate synthase